MIQLHRNGNLMMHLYTHLSSAFSLHFLTAYVTKHKIKPLMWNKLCGKSCCSLSWAIVCSFYRVPAHAVFVRGKAAVFRDMIKGTTYHRSTCLEGLWQLKTSVMLWIESNFLQLRRMNINHHYIPSVRSTYFLQNSPPKHSNFMSSIRDTSYGVSHIQSMVYSDISANEWPC